ncbi:MAG TPA: hypothetical protein VNF07_06635 [Acidimicrobiales bacterium]|nr:hypothetical protein [Acidimicrobiales bacterium]
MAQLAGVIYTSHAWVDRPWPEWKVEREIRHLRPDVPRDSDEEMAAKSLRMREASAALGDKLAELAPDLLLIFGDDQYEYFHFDNFPAISVYLGEEFTGRGGSEARRGKGHPKFATALLTGLMERGFDPAFSMAPPRNGRGMPHAVMNPLHYYDAWSIPTVPLLTNAYYAPQLSARRHLEVGRAARGVIEDYPDDLRVVAIGSGGLWHTPRRDGAYLDEDFDRRGLEHLHTGEIAAWAEHFDSYAVPAGDASQDLDRDVPEEEMRGGDHVTHLPSRGGPQAGTRETCNWIAAAGTTDGHGAVIVDYVPLYAAPIGVGFAYCDDF